MSVVHRAMMSRTAIAAVQMIALVRGLRTGHVTTPHEDCAR